MTRKDNTITDYTAQILRHPDNDKGRATRDTGDTPLPESRGKDAVALDRSGVNTRYLDQRGTPSGLDAKLNWLPPGMNIEDQPISRADDAGEMPYKVWQGHEKGYVEVGTANTSRKGK